MSYFTIRLGLLAALGLVSTSCKTPGNDASAVANAPSAGGEGGAPVDLATVWPNYPNIGMKLDCKSDDAMKKDFQTQLQHHLLYGDSTKVREINPGAADMADRFQAGQRALGINMHSFKDVPLERLFDGNKGFKVTVGDQTFEPQQGDVFLNFSFGNPNHQGNFYSKRGVIHTRMVVKYDAAQKIVTTFDGGWEAYSQLTAMHSQTVWLRPKANLVKADERKKIVKWAKVMEPSKYDNTLTDDWDQYRIKLNAYLAAGKPPAEAARLAIADSAGNFGPFGNPDTYKPKSGIYCSEGTTAIYSYLGFKMNGETPFDMITKFGQGGNLPAWGDYANALSSFGADEDARVFMMHQLFHSYFAFFDDARKTGLIDIPGQANAATLSFKDAATANIGAAMQDSGASDLIARQFEVALERSAGNADATQKITQLRDGLLQAAAQVGAMSGQPAGSTTISQAVYFLFFKNLFYGPYNFFENADHFDMIGVFYNSNLTGKYGSKWVSDWYLHPAGQPMTKQNQSTTNYRISRRTDLPDDKCVPTTEKAAWIQTD